jgi:hypothetical protein
VNKLSDPGLALFLYVLVVIAAFLLGPKWRELVGVLSAAKPGTTGTSTTGSVNAQSSAATGSAIPSVAHNAGTA